MSCDLQTCLAGSEYNNIWLLTLVPSFITFKVTTTRIPVNGFWGGRYEKTYPDTRWFNPHAPFNSSTISNCYRKHENEKKDRTNSRFATLNMHPPLVLSATGGEKQSTAFYKRLASILAEKWDQSYSSTLYWLRRQLSFSLSHPVHSWGSLHSWTCYHISSPIDLIRPKPSFTNCVIPLLVLHVYFPQFHSTRGHATRCPSPIDLMSTEAKLH